MGDKVFQRFPEVLEESAKPHRVCNTDAFIVSIIYVIN